MGVRTMRKGEKSQFMIDYPYAFGVYGCPPRIPEKAQIFATLELIDYKEETHADFILSIDGEERKKKYSFNDLEKIARLENSNGNRFTSEKELRMAFKCYERGRRLMEDVHVANEEEEGRCHKLLVKLLLNSAHCAIKLFWPRKACIACREALKIEESAKAFYRFGVAKRQLGDYQAAKDLLLKAQRKEPQSISISDELRFLEDDLVRERKREETLCKAMFRNVAKTTKGPRLNSAVCDIYRKELKEFRDDATQDVLTLTDPALVAKYQRVRLGLDFGGGKFFFVHLLYGYLQEIREAASDLGLSVELIKGRGKTDVVRIIKS